MPSLLALPLQGSLQALLRLVSQDITLCDGTGLELPDAPAQVCGTMG